jgi:hypothetical protein
MGTIAMAGDDVLNVAAPRNGRRAKGTCAQTRRVPFFMPRTLASGELYKAISGN